MSLESISDLTVPHSWCNQRYGIGYIDGQLRLNTGLLLEQFLSHPLSSISTYGQLWVKNIAPNNQLWFTDNNNNDYQLTPSSSSLLNTKGQLLTFSTQQVALNIGTNGQILVANSLVADGLGWSNTISDLGLTGNITSNLNPDGNLTRNLGTDDFLHMWNQLNVGTVSSHSNNLVLTTSLAGNIVLNPHDEIKLQTIGSNKLLVTNSSDGVASDFYKTKDSQTFNFAKASSTLTGTQNWEFSRISNTISAYFQNFTGTSSGAGGQIGTASGTIPSDYRPTTDLYFQVIVQDVTIQLTPGLLHLAPDGTVTFSKDLTGTAFTGAVTVGIPYDQVISYQIT